MACNQPRDGFVQAEAGALGQQLQLEAVGQAQRIEHEFERQLAAVTACSFDTARPCQAWRM
jgi:hypothetical protein